MRILRIAGRKLDPISLRDLIVSALPLALIAAAAFWFAYQFVKPAPPDTLVMSTGAAGGAYQAYAERYREILARDDVRLELRPSSGSMENLRRLQDESADVAFVQSGAGTAAEAPGLVSLGSLYYEPLWVFYRGNAALDRLSQLKGKRVAIGPEGSGIRKLALQLLAANDAEKRPTMLLEHGMSAAAKALQQGEIDAAFIVAGADSPVVQELLRAPGVRVMSMSQAMAYTRLFPFLSSVVLPQGAIDLARNLPSQDTTLLSATATLVAREDLHPALTSLLIQAATEVHGHAGLFQRAGEFPAPATVDFPLSEEARRFYKSGPSFLQRYLPFWVAVLVQRMLVMLVPIIAVLIPLLRILPSVYAWQANRRIYRWYGELKFLERELERNREPQQISEYLARLDHIEQRVARLKVPLAFSEHLYTLRQHIRFVRDLIRQSQER